MTAAGVVRVSSAAAAVTTVPVRVSESPRIKRKHREIGAAVFARKAIGSPGNCAACHRGAENGLYSEDNAVIPK